MRPCTATHCWISCWSALRAKLTESSAVNHLFSGLYTQMCWEWLCAPQENFHGDPANSTPSFQEIVHFQKLRNTWCHLHITLHSGESLPLGCNHCREHRKSESCLCLWCTAHWQSNQGALLHTNSCIRIVEHVPFQPFEVLRSPPDHTLDRPNFKFHHWSMTSKVKSSCKRHPPPLWHEFWVSKGGLTYTVNCSQIMHHSSRFRVRWHTTASFFADKLKILFSWQMMTWLSIRYQTELQIGEIIFWSRGLQMLTWSKMMKDQCMKLSCSPHARIAFCARCTRTPSKLFAVVTKFQTEESNANKLLISASLESAV